MLLRGQYNIDHLLLHFYWLASSCYLSRFGCRFRPHRHRQSLSTAPPPALVWQREDENEMACFPTKGVTNSQAVSFKFQIQHFVRDVKVKIGHIDYYITFNWPFHAATVWTCGSQTDFCSASLPISTTNKVTLTSSWGWGGFFSMSCYWKENWQVAPWWQLSVIVIKNKSSRKNRFQRAEANLHSSYYPLKDIKKKWDIIANSLLILSII